MIEPRQATFKVDFNDTNAPNGFWRVGYGLWDRPVIGDYHYYFKGNDSVLIEAYKKGTLYFITTTDDNYDRSVCRLVGMSVEYCSKEQFLDFLIATNHPILNWFLFNQDSL